MVDPDPKEPISAAECLARFREARSRLDRLVAGIESWTAESDEGWAA